MGGTVDTWILHRWWGGGIESPSHQVPFQVRGSFAEILGPSDFTGIHAEELGTGVATGKKKWTGSQFRAQRARRRLTLRRKTEWQRKVTALEWGAMEIICCASFSAIYTIFRTFNSDCRAAILETNSLVCASAGPIWMLCGHGRLAPWRATNRKEST
jgi:hypothetical protein